MKLRIKGNSIRLRLGQSEVRRLAIDGTVEESTAFAAWKDLRLFYAICETADFDAVCAYFADRRIVVRVPRKMIDQWATTDQVGIDALQRNGDGSELRILIEKDFECIAAAPDESQEDAFPNPQLGVPCAVGKND